MKVIEFPEQTVVIGKDEPEYYPLPAHRFKGEDGINDGRIACCWKLTIKERFKIIFIGKVWHQILTFNQPIQPQLLSIEKPKMNNT